MTAFPHLHTRSAFAPLQGMCRLPDLVGALAPAGVVAVTDPNLWAAAKLAKACGDHKARPRAVFGLEVRLSEHVGHFVLLARNDLGWRNLRAVASLVYGPREAANPAAVFSRKKISPPHPVSLALLVERRLLGGLAILTGGAGGALSSAMGGPIDDRGRGADGANADALITDLINAAAPWQADDNAPQIYVELSPTMGNAWRAAWDVAIRHDLDVVATGDVSFMRPEDAPSHEVLRAIAQKRRINHDSLVRGSHPVLGVGDGAGLVGRLPATPGTPPADGVISAPESWGHLASAEELATFFAECPAAIATARRLADECRVDLGLGRVALPDYVAEDGRILDAEAQVRELRGLAREGFERREQVRRQARRAVAWPAPYVESLEDVDEHLSRLERLDGELQVIEKTGFAGYFLIVADFCRWCRKNGVPLGPGRGSAAGSLAVYALGITDVDPVEYGLMFERFLNAERAGGMPDIDVDICKRGRARVVEYLRSRYGAGSVGRIANYKVLAGKTALKDIARVFGVGFREMNAVTAGAPALVEGKAPTVRWLADNIPSLRDAMADPQTPQAKRLAAVIRHALAVEGCVREIGVHASGVVVSRGPLGDWVPTCVTADGELSAAWAMEEVEAGGLVKFDLLGLSTVTHLSIAEGMINAQLSRKSAHLVGAPRIPEQSRRLERVQNGGWSDEYRGAHAADRVGRHDGDAALALLRSADGGTAIEGGAKDDRDRAALGGASTDRRGDVEGSARDHRGNAGLAEGRAAAATALAPDDRGHGDRVLGVGGLRREDSARAAGSGEDRLQYRDVGPIDGPRRPTQQEQTPTTRSGFSLDALPLDDAPTLRLCARADTLGVFQLCKGGMRRMLAELRPDRFADLTAAAALYRPGPIQGGMVKDYIQRRHGAQEVVYLHPAMESATSETYGVLAYQEQCMAMARALAGYSLGQADILRKAMGKKKKDVMDKERAKFIAGCLRTGTCDEARATQLFDLMAHWAGYGFNKSHSVCYSLLSYRTAYLKVHYPTQFYAAWLSILIDEADSTKKIAEAVYDARDHGVEVLPPCVHSSSRDFTPITIPPQHSRGTYAADHDFSAPNAVRYGLGGLRGLGAAAIASILDARAERPFTDIVDFLRRTTVTKRDLAALAGSGALDALLPPDVNRGSLIASLEALSIWARAERRAAASGQMALFG